ncbi:MAG: CrcB family protein [Paludibacter sp.]|nr:CrcB family protein [Paludibacter sp.]
MRYIIALKVSKHLTFDFAFPLGTLIINVTGCLIVGFLVGMSVRCNILNNELKLLLIVGFCGGLSAKISVLYWSSKIK